MKKIHFLCRSVRALPTILVFVLVVLSVGCMKNTPKEQPQDKIVATTTETLWHVKAITPEGKFLDIKAVDAFGSTFEVKAIEKNGQTNFMDIKAYVSGKYFRLRS